jgi:RNA polymerase sigma factor (sigma-70 family)
MNGAQATINVLNRLRHLVATGNTNPVSDGQLLERFTEGREEAAFEVLVRRHGPLVLGLCRRLLHNHHDAEDAFQATFWVLARKAGSIARHTSLAGWLYQVAYHTALRARARTANRQRWERRAGTSVVGDPLAEVTGRELVGVLHEALQRLPERLRTPLVLCYLEGRTRDEAARQLGWSLGTFKRRLEQGKELLRARLARRGLALPAVFLAAGLIPHTASALPPLWATVSARAAARAALGTPAGGCLAESAASLADGTFSKLSGLSVKTVAVGLLAGVLALGVGFFGHQVLAQRSPEATTRAAAAKSVPPMPPPEDKTPTLLTGRVTDAGGKAVAGAQVTVVGRFKSANRGGDFSEKAPRVLGEVKTDGDGKFRLAARRGALDDVAGITVFARAAGTSLGWYNFETKARRTDVQIKLLPDEVIRGRLVDLQGLPAASVRVYVSYVGQSRDGQFDGISYRQSPRQVPQWPAAARTNADGRFTIRGVNRTQGVGLWVSSDRFAPQQLRVMPGRKEITESLAPAQVLEGKVVCADTGKPVPHARLTVYSKQEKFGGASGLDGQADEQGRFRIIPYTGKFFDVAAYAPDGQPYLTLQKEVEWPKGAVKKEVRLELPAGVLVRGKVTDAQSGQPVPDVSVQFHPRTDRNKYLRNDVITGWQGNVVSGADGVFQIPVLPGPGHLLVCGPNLDYIHQEVGSSVLSNGKPGGMRYQPDALVKLDLDPAVRVHEVAVKMRRGVTVQGIVVGKDGKPIAKGLMICRPQVAAFLPYWQFPTELRDDRFELHGLDPKGSCPVVFLDPQERWGAVVTLSGKQAEKPVTVKLVPCGQASARFVNQRGEPLANIRPWIEIVVTPGPYRLDLQAYNKGLLTADGQFLANVDRHNYWKGPMTDGQGRCTFPALIPGVTYRIIDFGDQGKPPVKKEFTVESGRTRELGDIAFHRAE